MSEVRTEPRLGADFGRLWVATSISAIGDGVTLAAGPLLVASRTSSPTLVAGAAFVQQLPWLLFSLVAGAYIDRLDRRRLLVLINLMRATAVGALAIAVAAGAATLPVIYVLVFLVGIGEVLGLNAGGAFLPSLVPEDQLARANARVFGSITLGSHLLGPPVGAALFLLAPSVPFATDAVSFLLGGLLISRIATRVPPAPAENPTTLREDVRHGIAWLWRHPLLRLVAVCICIMNLTFGGTMAVYVLYAREQLGLTAQGYGLLLSVSAVGGLVGARLAAPLERRFGPGVLLRAGLLVEAATQTALGLTHHPWVAGAVMLGFGAHATVWGVITVSLRQRIVPSELRGRINGVYLLFSAGGMAIGSAIGGVVARLFGISAPYLLAGAVVGLLAVVTWRPFASGAPVSA